MKIELTEEEYEGIKLELKIQLFSISDRIAAARKKREEGLASDLEMKSAEIRALLLALIEGKAAQETEAMTARIEAVLEHSLFFGNSLVESDEQQIGKTMNKQERSNV